MDTVEPVSRAAGHGRRPSDQVLPARRQVEAVGAQVPVPEDVGGARERHGQPVLALADGIVLLHRFGLIAQHQRDAGDRTVAPHAREQHPIACERPPIGAGARERARYRLPPAQRRAPRLRQLGGGHGLEQLEDALSGQVLQRGPAEAGGCRVCPAHDEVRGQLEERQPTLLQHPLETSMRLRHLLQPLLLAPSGTHRPALGAVEQSDHRDERLFQLGALGVRLSIRAIDDGDQFTKCRRQVGAEHRELTSQARMHR